MATPVEGFHENTRPSHGGHPFDAGGGFASVGPLCRAAFGGLPVDGAAVVLQGAGDGREIVHVTDPVIAWLDEWQFTLAQGPAIDSYLGRRAVLVPDLHADSAADRWPGFTREAIDTGARAMFVFPLRSLGVAIGVVQFYGRYPGPLTRAELTTAALAAENLMVAILRDFAQTTTPGVGPDPQ